MTNKPISERSAETALRLEVERERRNPQVELLKEKLAAAESHIAALEQQLAQMKSVAANNRDMFNRAEQQLASVASHADNFEKKMWHYHQLAESECERANAAEQRLAAERADNARKTDLLKRIAKARPGGCYFAKWDSDISAVLSAGIPVEGE